MVNHHAAKFNDHRHCGSGDIMPSVPKDKNLRCSRLNSPLLVISKGHSLKAHDISF